MEDPHSPGMVGAQKGRSQGGLSSDSEAKPNQSPPGAKKRQSRAGTRSVSTLTAAQLERKRANDREAQRAIRQRTKEHIENLERRVAELSGSSDINQRNLELTRRNEELEQENVLLRNQLSHAMAALNVQESEAMSTSSSGIVTPGTRSPIERHSMMDQTPRMAPTSAARQLPMAIPQPQQGPGWTNHNVGYTASASSTIEARSAHPDVTPTQNQGGWDTQAHQVPPQLPGPESGIHTSPPAVLPHPAGYNYHVEQYAQPMAYQGESQHMAFRQAPAQPAPPPAYQTQHMGGQMAPNPGYPQYQSQVNQQGYMPNAPQGPEGLPGLMQRPPPQGHQPMMYNQR